VPASGKAIVYFLQDDLKYGARPRPTTRFAIDGNWFRATHANSFFYVSVDPGDHMFVPIGNRMTSAWVGLVLNAPGPLSISRPKPESLTIFVRGTSPIPMDGIS
jgi:hypothetical protein